MFMLLMPHPAALIKTAKTKTLIVADPHLGWEVSLQEKGIHVPSQIQRILKKLVSLLSKYKPDTLLVLGDVKYSVMGSGAGEWHDVAEFFNQAKKYVTNIGIVRGNHDANLDPMLPKGITMYPATGTIVDGVGLFHGHKWPSPELLACKTLVMGHLHPVVTLRDATGFKLTRPVWMEAVCNTKALTKVLLQKNKIKVQGTPEETLQKHYSIAAKTTQLFIMPSFNDLLGGRPINETHSRRELSNEELIGPVLRSQAVDVDNSEIYLTDGIYLGTLSQLRSL